MLTSPTAPGVQFPNRSALAAHYKSAFHQFNLVLHKSKQPSVTFEQFLLQESGWMRLPGKDGLWRELAQDEAVPRGSEVSMNMSSGKNFLRRQAQVATSQFSSTPLGHTFELPSILSKMNCKRCRQCLQGVYEHHHSEVEPNALRVILDLAADGAASVILPDELYVGSFKSVGGATKQDARLFVVNAAGRALHDFLPKSRSVFDQLREQDRVRDLEWQDSVDFTIDVEELVATVELMLEKVRGGGRVLVNCAQGKSRSGTVAVAYVMAKLGVGVEEGLKKVQQGRALVDPNASFRRQLGEMEGRLHEIETR
ncbi:hypothetical protein TeGR_g7902 [Tetraparma gracilis]|uniref:Tyrosine specific protein phosphatases domain-containing protein n=1 Tax=Tetraparma gracilis TaxID=2962635 RepID=A0ABQ6MWT1_9STRA|nr:hypothetical protein TeGR_g7902 [Tetraparma gracilis]